MQIIYYIVGSGVSQKMKFFLKNTVLSKTETILQGQKKMTARKCYKQSETCNYSYNLLHYVKMNSLPVWKQYITNRLWIVIYLLFNIAEPSDWDTQYKRALSATCADGSAWRCCCRCRTNQVWCHRRDATRRRSSVLHAVPGNSPHAAGMCQRSSRCSAGLC